MYFHSVAVGCNHGNSWLLKCFPLGSMDSTSVYLELYYRFKLAKCAIFLYGSVLKCVFHCMSIVLYFLVLIYCVYSLNSSIYYLFILLLTLRALLKNSYALVLDVLVQPANKLQTQTHLNWPPSIIKCCIIHIQLQTNHCFYMHTTRVWQQKCVQETSAAHIALQFKPMIFMLSDEQVSYYKHLLLHVFLLVTHRYLVRCGFDSGLKPAETGFWNVAAGLGCWFLMV